MDTPQQEPLSILAAAAAAADDDESSSDDEGEEEEEVAAEQVVEALIINSPLLRGSIRHSLKRVDDSTVLGADDSQVHQAAFLFSLVGVGYLFPFSALTQPVDYWNVLFPDFNIEFRLTTLYMWTNLLALGVLVFGGGTTSSSQKNNSNNAAGFSFTPRIVGGFTGQLLVLLVVPSSYFLNLSERLNAVAVLGSTAVVAVVTAFLDSSVIALASQYPVRVQESLQLGIGISTLIGSIYRDVTKLAFPPTMTVESSLLYFYSGAATVALCILAYAKLMSLDLSKKCLASSNKASDKQVVANDDDILLAPLPPTETSPLVIIQDEENHDDDDSQTTTNSELIVLVPNKWVVLRKVWFNELMVGMLFMSTLALWPPLVTEIASFNFPALQTTGWWPLILLTIFSLADCVGRILVRFCRLGLNKNNIWIAVVCRTILFPLIVCSVQGLYFTHDGFSVLFVALLGFTNGYVGTLTIILVNDACDSEAEKALAGTFTSFSLNTGLVCGATIGLALEQLVVVKQ